MAVETLLKNLETLPEWLDLNTLKQGADAFLSIGQIWVIFSLGPGSLTHTYSSPTVAKILVKTGNLTTMAGRRLAETSTWNYESLSPGGLLRGAPGYVHNLQVRMLHSRVRVTLQKRGWEEGASGIPINQLEMIRTWMDFTIVPFQAMERMGICFTSEETRDLYHYWQYIAHLLGIDERLYRPITDNTSAARLLDLIDFTTQPPTEDSRKLTLAMLETVADALQKTMPLPRAFLFDLGHAMTRRLHGDALSDLLGVRRTWVSLLMPAVFLFNRLRRKTENRTPERRRRAIEKALVGLKSMTAQGGETTYQTNAAGPSADLPKTVDPGKSA